MFIHENALERVVCKIVSILQRPQCVNGRLAKKEATSQEKTLCLYIIQNFSNVLEVLYGDLSVINGHYFT